LKIAINVYEYGRGGKCVYMFRYTHTGIRDRDLQMEKESRHMSRVMSTLIGTMTQVSIKFAEKGKGKEKSGYDYGPEHTTRSARKTGRKIGREENIHTLHRLIETGKQTRDVRGEDQGYDWYSAKVGDSVAHSGNVQ